MRQEQCIDAENECRIWAAIASLGHQRSSAVLLRSSQPKIKQRHNERHPPRRPQIPQPQTHLHHHHAWHTRGLGLDVNLVRRERGDEVGKVDVEDGCLGWPPRYLGRRLSFESWCPISSLWSEMYQLTMSPVKTTSEMDISPNRYVSPYHEEKASTRRAACDEKYLWRAAVGIKEKWGQPKKAGGVTYRSNPKDHCFPDIPLDARASAYAGSCPSSSMPYHTRRCAPFGRGDPSIDA